MPPTPIPTASDGVTTIDSGDVLATVGESVGLNQNGATVFSVTMNDIGFETTCPSRLEGTVTAEQTFIIANFEAELSESFTDADTSDPFIALGSDVFAVYGKDGQVDEEAHSARAFECYSTEELIAPVIYPGETESGYVVLETDLTDGYLVFNPWGVAGSGWAWEFSK